MIETRVQRVSKMSGKRNKSGQKSPGHVVASAENLAEKERADRIAAAEAMSCLSSVILLSSDLEKDADVASPPKETTRGQKRTRNSQKSPHGTKAGTESKRGKSRSGRGRGARSTNHQRGASTVRLEGNPRDANNMVEGVMNEARGVSRLGGQANEAGINNSDRSQERVAPIPQGSRVGTAPPRTRQGGVATPTNIQPVSNIPNALQLAILSKLTASARDHRQASNEQLVLKLPLVINNETTEVKSLSSPTAQVSPASAASTDSVEFTQSTVDRLLQPPNSNKFDSLDSALPLKKRKLLSYMNSGSQEDSVSMVTSQASKHEKGGDVVDLTMVKVEPEYDQHQQVLALPSSASSVIVPVNATPVTSATLNPVSVDPRTSLMLLTEMQMALQQDEDGDLPLHIAVAQENIVMVQKFVHLMSISGKSVDKYNKAQQTPLHLAVELDFVDAVKTLLLARANPNLVNKRGENAVHLAVKVQSSACLEFMMQHSQNKTDLNTRNFEGLAPLHTAVERNDERIVDMLLRAGADINILDGKSGKTPLFYAVEHNFLSMIEFLQLRCANVDLTNYAGITVVMAAQARGYQDAATLLLKGMDSQAYHEIKESTPTKKIPIPRIPSKSHLIVNTENVNSTCTKNFKFTIHNTDSNSSESSVRPYQGVIAQCLGEEPMSVSDSTDIKQEMNSDNRLSAYQFINLVPKNLLNGRDQLDNTIPQTQSRAEVNIPEIPRQLSPAFMSSSGSRQGFESKRTNTPPLRKTPFDVKHNPSSEIICSSQSPKSHDQTPRDQTVSRTSVAQLHQSQAPSTTNQVQSMQSQLASSLLSSSRHQSLYHSFPHYKSSADPDNSQPGGSKHHHVESPPLRERHSHHKESSLNSRDSSTIARDGSPHLRENSINRSESSTHAINSNIQSRENSQNPINSTNNMVNSLSNQVKRSLLKPPINTSSNLLNSSFSPSGTFHNRDKSTHPKSSSPHQRDSSPYRSHSQKRIVKVNSSGKMHVEKAGSASKGQSSGSSKGSVPASQMYHLTNISRSTKDILAAKLQGIYTSKAGQANRPLNLSTGTVPDSVNVKEET
ncbi:ankycorbin-like [Pecten maximus]|uniref:ankycorbin-like n=1 Tax=Pecten maximus TaxID=6579 RepID=UPI0014588B3A|nr:ankycorbin-like [Pecten maximus]